MNRASSLRRTEAPMPWAAVVSVAIFAEPSLFARRLFGRCRHLLAVHQRPGGGDRLDDVMIACATAEIALQPFADLVLGQTLRMALHQVDRAHDHAGRTEPALQRVMFTEHFL